MMKRFTLLMLLGIIVSCGHKGPQYPDHSQKQVSAATASVATASTIVTPTPIQTPTSPVAVKPTPTATPTAAVKAKFGPPHSVEISLSMEIYQVSIAFPKGLKGWLAEGNHFEKSLPYFRRAVPYVNSDQKALTIEEREIEEFSMFWVVGDYFDDKYNPKDACQKIQLQIIPTLHIGDKIFSEDHLDWRLVSLQKEVVDIKKLESDVYEINWCAKDEDAFPALFVKIDNIADFLEDNRYALFLDVSRADQSQNRLMFIDKEFDMSSLIPIPGQGQIVSTKLKEFIPELGHHYISITKFNLGLASVTNNKYKESYKKQSEITKGLAPKFRSEGFAGLDQKYFSVRPAVKGIEMPPSP